MAPTLVRAAFHRDGWVYEEKFDGWRMLAYKDGARVRLVSRNGRDHTQRFAGIAAAVAKLSARALVLDGEVAIYDEKLRSRFDWLRESDADADNAALRCYIALDHGITIMLILAGRVQETGLFDLVDPVKPSGHAWRKSARSAPSASRDDRCNEVAATASYRGAVNDWR